MTGTPEGATRREGSTAPDRDYVNALWYIAGFGTATYMIGITGVVNEELADVGLTIIGALILVGIIALVVVLRD